MWWQYLLVFLGAFFVDVVPIPFPPAFTVMIFFQMIYYLNIWLVILLGCIGSIIGRFSLSVYISKVSDRIFNKYKNEDARYLGKVMKSKGWKGQAGILLYSLLPLPTTPLFVAGGMAKVKPVFMIIPFMIGKLTSDILNVFLGKYAIENTTALVEGFISIKSISGLVIGLLLLTALLFIDWISLLQKKKLVLKFHIWK